MPPPFSFRRAVRATPPAVWAATALWAVLLVLWSVLPPPFIAADEPQHVDLAIDARGIPPWAWPEPEAVRMSPPVLEAQRVLGFYDPRSLEEPGSAPVRRVGGRTAAEVVPREERPSYDQLAAEATDVPGRVNQMAQHPPLHYRLIGGALAAAPGWEDLRVDVLVALMRLFSALWVLPLPLLAAWTARAVLPGPHVEATAALSVLVVPQVAHLGSVVTNDSSLIGVSALLTVLVANLAAGDVSRRTAVRTGAVLLVALLVKGFALFLPLAVVAALLAALRRGVGWRRAGAALGWVVLVSAAGAWWYAENLLRYGTVQPSVAAPSPPAEQGSLEAFADLAARVLGRTFWGSFGWAETGFDPTTSLVLTVVLVALVVVGLLGRDPLVAAALALPGTVVVAITLAQSYAVFGTDGGIRAVAGRYFAISLCGVLALAASGLVRLLPGWSAGVAPWLVLYGGVGVQGLSWVVALRYFYLPAEGAGGLDRAVATFAAWGPWPPVVLQVLLGLLLLAVLAVVVSLVQDVRRTTLIRVGLWPGDRFGDGSGLQRQQRSRRDGVRLGGGDGGRGGERLTPWVVDRDGVVTAPVPDADQQPNARQQREDVPA